MVVDSRVELASLNQRDFLQLGLEQQCPSCLISPDTRSTNFPGLVALANRRVEELRGKRIKELQAEIGKLGARQGQKGQRLSRKSRQPHLLQTGLSRNVDQ